MVSPQVKVIGRASRAAGGRNTEELRQFWNMDKTWHPDMPAERRAHYYKSWKKAVQRSFAWVDED